MKAKAEIRIVADRPDWVVIEKPPLVDSQNSKPGRASVVDWLTGKYGFAGLVHRLDMGTSGLMICAKNDRAAKKLTEMMNDGKIKRTYQALVLGRTLPDSGELATPVDGKDALSRYRVLDRFNNACLVEVDLETGRKHQIRVQFSEAGHPLLGDRLHGKKGSALLFDRPALHAAKLRVDGEEFVLELPEDMQALMRRWKAQQ